MPINSNRKELSQKDIEQYVKSSGGYCPFCHSREITLENTSSYYDYVTNLVYRDWKCENCNRTWTDLYKIKWIPERKEEDIG